MEKKRNIAPESSQLVEPPLKQHKSESEQDNLYWTEEKEDDQAFELFSTRSFGQTNSAFGSSMRRSSSTPALGSSSTSFGAFEQSSTIPFGQTNSVFGASCSPAFRSSMRRSSSIPAFDSSSIVRTLIEAVWKQTELEAIRTAEQAAFGATSTPAFGATSTLPFGMRRLEVGEPSTPFTIVSYPAITEEDGERYESISAMPAHNYERYESCFAIAGADYCVIAADFTRGHTKISELSRKSVMASCGFQADVNAMQEAFSAKNLRYECEHNKPMSCPEMHKLLNDLQECHPNHVFIVLGGLDNEGKGCIFQHFGRGATIASGVGHPGSRRTVPPILKYKLPAEDVLARLSETEAVGLAKDVFKSVTNTGDKLEIVVLNARGLHRDCVDLKKDCP